MYTIKNTDIDNAMTFEISKAQWGYDKYMPKVFCQISHDDSKFYVRFKIYEKDPLRDKIKDFDPVNEDSCVEFFANFMPESSEYYINFETNANGKVNFSFRKSRYDYIDFTEDDAKSLDVDAKIFDDYWTVDYTIKEEFLKKYYKEFSMSECKKIKCNLYKCGDLMEIEHYIAYFDVGCENPDYHRPEYFGEFIVE